MVVINGRFLSQKITGVQRFAIDFALNIKKKSDDILILAPENILDKEIAERLDAKVLKGFCSHLWEQITLPMYLKKIGEPILLNLTNSAPIFYKNKVTTVCDISNITNPEWFSKKYRFFYKIITPSIVRTSKKVITISEFSKCEINKYLNKPLNEIEVVYCALPSNFKKKSPIIKSLRKNYFLCVSSLNPRKNFDRTVNAFKNWNKGDYHLYIVGDNGSAFADQNLLDRMDSNIKFLGRVTDQELFTLYEEANGFLYLSLYEGFGIPPLEAQALNCPVLASDIPVLHEVLGESALFCNPTDTYDIMRGLDNLLGIDIDSITQKGQDNITRFSWDSSADKILHILENIRL